MHTPSSIGHFHSQTFSPGTESKTPLDKRSNPTTGSGPSAGSASSLPGSSRADDGSRLRWFKTVNKHMSRGGHPYQLQAMRLQDPKEKRKRNEDVRFWPFVGPLRPGGKPEGVAEWSWEEYEGTVAVCTEGKLTVARCTQQDPWLVLWEMTLEDHPYCLAWTYHPLTMHPLIAIAGQGALIYLIDAITKQCLRVLKGHGDDILSLTFHSFYPHILASTSSDKTTRIWNILGTDPPPLPPGDLPNENYPMGDADEGNVIVAILAGEGSGGHRAYVASSAFHPSRRAIATCGLDYTVKIWPLPPFPPVCSRPQATPKGYRPSIVSFPIFSTNRLHQDFVDNIDWLSEDVLFSRSNSEIVTWHWLGYKRYFPSGAFGIPNDHIPVYDYTNSSSFMIISRYPNSVQLWGQNVGYHRAFNPTPKDKARTDNHLVTDPLLALTTHRLRAALPEISLWNPLLAEDDPPPEPCALLRYVPEDDEYGIYNKRPEQESLRDSTDVQGDAAENENENDPSAAGGMEGAMADVTMDDTYTPLTPASMPTPPAAQGLANIDQTSPKRSGVSLPASETGTGKDTDKQKAKKNASLAPWRLVADSVWNTFVRGHRELGLERQASVITNVAISPRGAEWIVGVGIGESVLVWRAKNTAVPAGGGGSGTGIGNGTGNRVGGADGAREASKPKFGGIAD